MSLTAVGGSYGRTPGHTDTVRPAGYTDRRNGPSVLHEPVPEVRPNVYSKYEHLRLPSSLGTPQPGRAPEQGRPGTVGDPKRDFECRRGRGTRLVRVVLSRNGLCPTPNLNSEQTPRRLLQGTGSVMPLRPRARRGSFCPHHSPTPHRFRGVGPPWTPSPNVLWDPTPVPTREPRRPGSHAVSNGGSGRGLGAEEERKGPPGKAE